MALSKQKLESIKTQLVQQREALAEDVRSATNEMIEEHTSYADESDSAQAESDKSFKVALKNRDRQTLKSIDEALRRIDAGTFGLCLGCGEEITENRLKAAPFTVLCLDCQSEREGKGARR